MFKKITHIRRMWGTPQNFFLTFIDKLEKQIIIKKNHDHMLYCSLDMAYNRFIFHFGLFFTLLPPLQPKKSKLKKN